MATDVDWFDQNGCADLRLARRSRQAQGQAMAGSNSVLGGGGFHHVAIKVRDFDAAWRFYTEALGLRPKVEWRIGQTTNRAVMLDTGDGNYLEVFEAPDFAPAPNGAIIHFALRCADVDAAVERCRAAGARVTTEPKDVTIPSTPPTPVRLAFVEAPEGVVIEFFANELT
jgi:glyoxylase I family protein